MMHELNLSRQARRIALTVMLTASGCMDGGGKMQNLVPVSGTVSLAGTPLDHGSIALIPVDSAQGQQAFGEIRAGQFVMRTTVSDPGVAAGSYQVQIISLEDVDPADLPTPDQPPIKIESLIPEKYNSVETSGLDVEIAKGMAPLNFDLEP